MKQITGTISFIFLGPYYITKYHIYIYIYCDIYICDIYLYISPLFSPFLSISLYKMFVCIYIYIYAVRYSSLAYKALLSCPN